MDLGPFDPGLFKELFDRIGGLKSVAEATDIAVKVKKLLGKGEDAKRADPATAQLLQLVSDLIVKLDEANKTAMRIDQHRAMLEAKLNEIVQQVEERKNYKLVELMPGSLAYTHKEGAGSQEPVRHFCIHCLEQERRLSTLQLKVRDFNFDTLECRACGALVQKPNDNRMTILTAPRDRTLW